MLVFAGFVLLSACAPSSNAGIPFVAGAADPEVQALARRAREGDKQAQLELGTRYEEGRGVPRDLARAERLYLMASLDRGGRRNSYSPSLPGSSRAGTVSVSQGPHVAGIPEARRAWIRVRGERLAQEAADAAPQQLSLESYLARRFTSDRQLANPDVAQIPIRAIEGPIDLSAHLARGDVPETGGEICDAVESLVRHYRDFGFERCLAWRYTRADSSAARGAPPIYAIDYLDRYEQSEEFRSYSGHFFYRPPFAAEPGAFTYEVLCGEFSVFEITLRSGRKYRLLIGSTPTSDRRRSRRPRSCGQIIREE